VPRDRIELPTRGFSAHFTIRRKTVYFQNVDYVGYSIGDFGNLGQNLIKFDLDGHNLGTISDRKRIIQENILYFNYKHLIESCHLEPIITE
jgi:hypothetical protein